jgi:thioredoxin 1
MSDRDDIRKQTAEQIRQRLGDDTDDATGGGDSPNRDEPVHVTDGDHLQQLIGEGGVVLVDFYADWCGPCKMLEPIVADVAGETAATVAKVDIDEHQRLAQQYQVQGVPTMYLFADGETAERIVGVRDRGELFSLVERHD